MYLHVNVFTRKYILNVYYFTFTCIYNVSLLKNVYFYMYILT